MSGRRSRRERRFTGGFGKARALVVTTVLAMGLVLACSGSEPPAAPPPPQVEVERARVGPLADRREYVGNVRSVDRVEVRARVRGYLVEQLFEDGARVDKGDPLFRIDPRPFEVALAEARGQLARARATAIRAEQDLVRAQGLFDKGVLSTEVIDQRRAERDTTAAEVEAAEAAARAAELDLSYCNVRAPVAGRMGRALVDVGNLVGESGQDTILAELIREDPIYVYFAASEGEAFPRESGAPAGGAESGARSTIPVRLVLGDGTTYAHEGVVDYVEPTVDAMRGTVTLRALLPNPEGTLRPGQFVRVISEFPDLPDTVLIPERAVLDEQGGSYVLLVGDDDIVVRRPIRPGRLVEGWQEILAGLAGGERVIVDGMQGARPGSAVRVEPIASDAEARKLAPPGKPGAGEASRPSTRG